MAPVGPMAAAPVAHTLPRPGPQAGLDEWLCFGDSLNARGIDMGLARVQAVRTALGLQPRFVILTVAGTNGKGSTCAMLTSLLRAGGYRVGAYTSPHLVRFNERVCVDGLPVSDADLCAAFARVDAARGNAPLTLFEFGTLAAMCVFEHAGLDAAVLEVGLGGRLDAVNVFDPDVSIVTSIGIDHVEYLGHTREAIGREKAGVFRRGRPAISADPDPPRSLAETAQRVGARLLQGGRDYRVEMDGDDWWLRVAPPDDRSPRGDRTQPGEQATPAPPIGPAHALGPWPRPALCGAVQLHNAAACLMALRAVAARLPLSPAHCRAGLLQVRVAGRFQRIDGAALQAAGVELVLDVAHNPHAAQALAQTLAEHPVPGRCLAVFAMLRDKDMAGTASALAGQVDAWFIAGIAERRGASADEVAAALDTALTGHPGSAGAGRPVHRCEGPLDAFGLALAEARAGDRVLVFGSFATVGAVLGRIEGIA